MLVAAASCLLLCQSSGVSVRGRMDGANLVQGEPILIEWTFSNTSAQQKSVAIGGGFQIETLRDGKWVVRYTRIASWMPNRQQDHACGTRLKPKGLGTVGFFFWDGRVFEPGEYRISAGMQVSGASWTSLPPVRLSVREDMTQAALWKRHGRGLMALVRGDPTPRSQRVNGLINAIYGGPGKQLKRVSSRIIAIRKLLRLGWTSRVRSALSFALAQKLMERAYCEPGLALGHLQRARQVLEDVEGSPVCRMGFRARRAYSLFLIACQARERQRAATMARSLLELHAEGDGSKAWARGIPLELKALQSGQLSLTPAMRALLEARPKRK